MTNPTDTEQPIKPREPTAGSPVSDQTDVPSGVPPVSPGWKRLVLVIVLTVVLTAAIGVGLASTVIGGALIGFGLLYAGPVYGLAVLVINMVWRFRVRRSGSTTELNAYSVFNTVPQISSFILNAILIIAIPAFYLFSPQHGQGIMVPAAVFGPAFGGALIGLSIPALLSRRAITGEVHAGARRLPAARWIRASLITRWIAYVFVTAAVVINLTGYQLPGDDLYPAQRFYQQVPPGAVGAVSANERINGLGAIDTEPRLGYRVVGPDAYNRYVALAQRAGATCKTDDATAGSRNGSCTLDGTTVEITEFQAGDDSILGNMPVENPTRPGIDLSITVPRSYN